MRVFLRVLPLRATLFVCVVLAFPAMAAAKQPDCPCWETRSLLRIVTELIADEGDILSCDQNPTELSHRRQISQSATIVGPTYEIEASQELGASAANESTCTVFIVDRVIVQPLKKNEFWRCAEDITKLCRELDAPPIE